jgi:hypothetical protein
VAATRVCAARKRDILGHGMGAFSPAEHYVIIFHSIRNQRFSRFRADTTLETVQLEEILSLFSAKIMMSKSKDVGKKVSESLRVTATMRAAPGAVSCYVFYFHTSSSWEMPGSYRSRITKINIIPESLSLQHLCWDREPHLTRRCQVACYTLMAIRWLVFVPVRAPLKSAQVPVRTPFVAA